MSEVIGEDWGTRLKSRSEQWKKTASPLPQLFPTFGIDLNELYDPYLRCPSL
jgi:hypothetical protein